MSSTVFYCLLLLSSILSSPVPYPLNCPSQSSLRAGREFFFFCLWNYFSLPEKYFALHTCYHGNFCSNQHLMIDSVLINALLLTVWRRRSGATKSPWRAASKSKGLVLSFAGRHNRCANKLKQKTNTKKKGVIHAKLFKKLKSLHLKIFFVFVVIFPFSAKMQKAKTTSDF